MLLVNANFSKTNVLTVLLEFTDLFNVSDNIKGTLGGLLFPLLFYIAIFHSKHSYILVH